jgi:hypothetical protein
MSFEEGPLVTKRLFCVRDEKAETWTEPFFERTRGTAERAFADAVANEEHHFHRHAEDFALYEVGSFCELEPLDGQPIHGQPATLLVTANQVLAMLKKTE